MSGQNRELSLHQVHELMLKLEAAGLTDIGAQRVIESKGNQLAEKVVRLISGRKLSWQEAREIMKGNFFGPDEWMKFFNLPDRLTTVPEFPWTEDELVYPGLKQEHFLFLGLSSLGNTHLDLMNWYQRGKGVHDMVRPALANKFALSPCQYRWYLMTVGYVEGSLNLSFNLQVASLPSDYEVPLAIERFTANMLYKLLHADEHGFMDWSCWVRTRDQSNDGLRVEVMTSTYGDLGAVAVRCASEEASFSVGLAASRQI